MNDIGLLHGIILAVLMFSWCKADAAARNLTAPKGAALAVGLIAPLGLPYYLFRTRHWKAAAIAILKAIGFLVVCILLWSGSMWVSRALAL